MDFDFSPEQQAFADEVERVPRRQRRPRRLRPHPGEHGPDRRHAEAAGVHGASSASRAGSGITWPKEYGGHEGDGVYEYLLNEALAGRGGPQIGKGVGIIGKTIIAPRQRLPEAGVPADDPAQRGRVRGRLQRAQRRLRRRVDAAQGRRATATAGCSTARRRGPPRRTSPSGTGSAPAPTPTTSTRASRCSSCRSTSPASRSTASGRWATSAPTRCSSTTCSCPTTTWSAR